MSTISDNMSSWSDTTPTLPDIEQHVPLALFLTPFGYDGDASGSVFANPPEPSAENTVAAEPERYVVTEAVQDPESTEVPETVPIVDQVPVGTAVVHEVPAVSQGERAKSSSSSSSNSSISTTRPADSIPATEVQRKSSVTFDAEEKPTLNRKSTTFVIQVPEEPHAAAETSLVRRRSTTIKVVIEPGHSSDEHPTPFHKTSTQTIRVPPEQPPLVTPADASQAEHHRPILRNKADESSVTSKQSKRERIRALWRRLIALIMKKRAERAARKTAQKMAKDAL